MQAAAQAPPGAARRYIVVGPGGVGGTIGALLAAAGRQVVLVARGAHLAALRSDGLRLLTPGSQTTASPEVAAGPGDIGLAPGDVLLLCVKGQDTAGVLDQWAGQPMAGGGLAADGLPVVCAQNGVQNERTAARRFAHVYGMCVHLPGMLIRPGVVAAAGSPVPGILEVGRYPAGADEASGQLAADLSEAGFRAYQAAQVMSWKYGKLLQNLANSVVAACGTAASAAAAELASLARAEALACYAAAGIAHLDIGAAHRQRGDRCETAAVDGAPRGGGSSWQSLQRQAGSIETDYLNGEIVLLGRLYQIPVPANALLQQVANRLARQRREPGSVDPDELLAALG